VQGAAVLVEDLSLLLEDQYDRAPDRNDAQGLIRRVEDEGSPQLAVLLPLDEQLGREYSNRTGAFWRDSA
jgi:hypothetical protein